VVELDADVVLGDAGEVGAPAPGAVALSNSELIRRFIGTGSQRTSAM
jgi:hypothetical protein